MKIRKTWKETWDLLISKAKYENLGKPARWDFERETQRRWKHTGLKREEEGVPTRAIVPTVLGTPLGTA